jgi:hypothetical protein
MAGKPALLKAPPEPPSGAAGAQVPAGVAAGKAGTGPLARPVRLTLGGLTAALESVVEEGKLGLTRPGMCGRKLLIRRCPILITTARPAQRPSAHIARRRFARGHSAHTAARLTAVTVRAFGDQAPGRIPVRRPAVCSHPPAR